MFLGKARPNQVRPLAAALPGEDWLASGFPSAELTKPKSRPRSGQGDPDSLCYLLASGKPQSSKRDRPYTTPPVLRGKKRGKDGPEGRQLWGKLKKPKKDPFPASPARGYSALARPLQAGRWAENPPCQPSLSPPRAPHPGDSARRFSFLFQFLPASSGILCQEDSALSLLRPRPPPSRTSSLLL